MKRGEKLKFYIKLNDRYYRLFNVIQMGKDEIVDLKITDFYRNFVIMASNKSEDKGYLTEDEFNNLRFVQNVEMSYHKDGSFLHKIKDGINPEYSNPYGQGERWTATDEIVDFQPIMYIAIRRMEIFKNSSLQPKLKSKETLYICENEELFERDGTYFLILYIRNKKHTVNCYTSSSLFSDIIMELNSDLDLCIFIQRHSYPKPKPYFSKELKCFITPYMNNSINFCDRDLTMNEMRDKFDNAIFDLTFNKFLSLMSDDKFINLSEDKLQLIDQVDILYKGNEGKMPLPKPVFIKHILTLFGIKLSEYNNLTADAKQGVLVFLNNLLLSSLDVQNKSNQD